jgi:hypothetical protein
MVAQMKTLQHEQKKNEMWHLHIVFWVLTHVIKSYGLLLLHQLLHLQHFLEEDIDLISCATNRPSARFSRNCVSQEV